MENKFATKINSNMKSVNECFELHLAEFQKHQKNVLVHPNEINFIKKENHLVFLESYTDNE